jgi:hypothetical protein
MREREPSGLQDCLQVVEHQLGLLLNSARRHLPRLRVDGDLTREDEVAISDRLGVRTDGLRGVGAGDDLLLDHLSPVGDLGCRDYYPDHA